MKSIRFCRLQWRRLSALASFATLSAVVAPAAAQLVAVPYYEPSAFVAALEARHLAPQAARFAASAGALVDAISGLCASTGESNQAGARQDNEGRASEARAQARDAWLAAAESWERLQAVLAGATVERRSAIALDFRPARPALIKRSVGLYGKAPPDAKTLERVGAPAKGLPALEWLLWDPDAPQTRQSCRYSLGLAQEVQREAGALASAHAADALRDWREEPDAAAERAAEAVNQWLAGLEALRWRNLGKPLSMLVTKDGTPQEARPDGWPRPSSASHRDAWRARWESLRSLAIGPAPTDGFTPQPAVAPDVISLESLLRGRGRNSDADGWAQVIMTADEAMQALKEESLPPSAQAVGREVAPSVVRPAGVPPLALLQEAVKALDAVKQYMQDTVAPGLKVNLGFSDADGD